jgi:DNA polymerase III subunit epsilon
MFNALKRKLNRSRLNDEAYAFLFDEHEGEEMVVFDTETTGLDPKKDEILSIGALILKDDIILTSKTF